MPEQNDISIRFATSSDCPTILGFIKELAEYEHMADQVVATEELLNEWIFVRNKAQVLIAYLDGAAVGFALYFNSFSTFLGRAGIYLEDLYVQPAARHSGVGKALLIRLAQICEKEGFGRLEWACLNWNEPSIGFYLSLGAQQMDQWTTYRLTGDSLQALAANAEI